MVVLAVKHGKLPPLAAEFLALLLDAAGDVGGLDFLVAPGNDLDRLARPMIAPFACFGSSSRSDSSGERWYEIVAPFSANTGGFSFTMPNAQRRIGESERRFFSSATTVGGGKLLGKQSERFARRAAKLVDRLIGIADGEDVRRLTSQQRENFDLRKVRILKFIHQQEASAPAFFFEQRGVILQQTDRPR